MIRIKRPVLSGRPGILLSPIGIFLAYMLAAFMLTYPLMLHALSHIPRGSEKVGTVPYFNLWTLHWNITQLMQGYPHYWDASIFAPYTGTFALSEPQLLSGLLAAPLWLSLQSPTLAYNALIVLFLTLNGWFAYWLMRAWSISHLPAVLTGFLVQALPFVAQEMGVLQMVALFGFLWTLLFLSRFLNQNALTRSTWQTNLVLALGTPVMFLTCSYYGLFSIFFLPLALLCQWRRIYFRFRLVRQLLLIGLIALLLTGPLLYMQQQRLAANSFTRTTQSIENNSAKLKYYGYFLEHNLLYAQILGIESGQGQRLFPGIGLVLLAIIGLVGLKQTRIKAYLILAIILALMLSIGLRLNLAGIQPYQWVRDYVPGYAQLRSPFRFAGLVQLHVALLAGFGLFNLGHWLSSWRNPVLPLIAGLIWLESIALPLPLQAVTFPQEAAPWQSWLNQQEQVRRIVLLPFATGSGVANFEQTSRWMLLNHYFQGDMLNGYSGFFPPDHGNLRDKLSQFPSGEALSLLRNYGVSHVVVYRSLPGAPRSETIEAYLPLKYLDESNQVAIYALPDK